MLDLLGVHEPGADGADKSLLTESPVRESDEDVAAGGRCPDAEIACLDR